MIGMLLVDSTLTQISKPDPLNFDPLIFHRSNFYRPSTPECFSDQLKI